MKKLKFIFQYILNPRAVGAPLPSSSFLGDKMLEGINFKQAKYLVEYGPGTGVFTDKLLEKRNLNTVIILIENNKEFCLGLEEKYKKEPNLIIINGSAEYINQYLKEYHIPYADYVISGLPFTSLPKKVSVNILRSTQQILKRDGKFITFQYSQYKKGFIHQFFKNIEVKRELRNLPPAYVFSCGS